YGLDSFVTRNHFSGGQVGLSGRFRSGKYLVEASGSVGVGITHQTAEINGFTTLNVPPQAATTGNIFTQNTNLGRLNRDAFSYLPQGRVTVGYQVFECVRIFGGVDFLYWSNVLRPQAQMDNQINPSLIPVLDDGTRVGPPRPLPRLNPSE